MTTVRETGGKVDERLRVPSGHRHGSVEAGGTTQRLGCISQPALRSSEQCGAVGAHRATEWRAMRATRHPIPLAGDPLLFEHVNEAL
jgi:hypothetical protein